MTEYLDNYLELQMAVGKIGGVAGNNPGAKTNELAQISIETGIAPVMKMESAYIKNVASLLQLLSAMGRSRDKAQFMHLIWGADRRKYTLLLDNMRNNLLRGHNNYPKMVSEAYSILLQYKNDAVTYIRNIKNVYVHFFSTDGVVEDRNKKTARKKKRRRLDGRKEQRRYRGRCG